MTSIIIDDKKKGAREMLDLLRVLDFVTSFEVISKNNTARIKRQRLIKYPDKYDPLALAGAAESSPLDLSEIRKEWTKKK